MPGTTLAQARRQALALPGASEAPHFQRTSFRVRGKIFATAQEEHLHVFVGEEARSQALALHPGCVEKLPWGTKVVGLRVHLPKAPPAVVAGLLEAAWRAKAPRPLQ